MNMRNWIGAMAWDDVFDHERYLEAGRWSAESSDTANTENAKFAYELAERRYAEGMERERVLMCRIGTLLWCDIVLLSVAILFVGMASPASAWLIGSVMAISLSAAVCVSAMTARDRPIRPAIRDVVESIGRVECPYLWYAKSLHHVTEGEKIICSRIATRLNVAAWCTIIGLFCVAMTVCVLG